MTSNVMYAASQGRRRAWGLGAFGDRTGDIASSDAPGAAWPDMTPGATWPDLTLGATPLTSDSPGVVISAGGERQSGDTTDGTNWADVGAQIGSGLSAAGKLLAGGAAALNPGGPGSPGLVSGPPSRNPYNYGSGAPAPAADNTGLLVGGALVLGLGFLLFKK